MPETSSIEKLRQSILGRIERGESTMFKTPEQFENWLVKMQARNDRMEGVSREFMMACDPEDIINDEPRAVRASNIIAALAGSPHRLRENKPNGPQ